MARLDITDVSKLFDTVRAVDRFSITVEDGELVCLLGPSGSGKSTLLRMVGGFEKPTSGSITIDGEEIVHLPPEKRPTGMVFQSHALWTHMNVYKNLAFGLKLRRLPANQIREKVEAVLELVGLGGYGNRLTHQLSGGQQQRVALARSLVLEPKILLLDEPFASLDQHLRERLREEVRDIQQRLKITTLFVTHAQDEALAVSDRIVVMRDGRTEQIARPAEVYREPATPFVAGFIGQMNLLDGAVTTGRFVHSAFSVPVPVGDGPAVLAVRPEALAIAPAADAPMAHIHRVTDYGTHAMVDVELPDGERLKSMMPTADRWSAGQPVHLLPGAFALYRDGAVIHRTVDSPVASQAVERTPVDA
ncbi:MAG TPA: ABC transporter ATP-binding protein [Devosiaceae bacterium]|jgi:putative spermidine/putrescine transport system ATP-binding protein|nr:ABC transporter ATP-binding protein [Devosiaceae bacterium]